MMDNAYANAIDGDFPSPRPLRSTREERRASSLSRHVYLSKLKQQRKPPRSFSRGALVTAIAGAAVALLVALNIFGGPLSSAMEPVINAGSAGAPENASTPRHLWMRGAMPFLYQTDPEWAECPYADGTVATHGCGPTCLAMVYVHLTGKQDMGPAQMAAFSERGGYIDSGLTSWLLMSEGAQQLGLRSQEVPADVEMVKAHLRAGNPIICSVGPGDFTDQGHFIALCGLDDSGRLIVHDPNSAERSQQLWDVERILPQCLNLWAFTA